MSPTKAEEIGKQLEEKGKIWMKGRGLVASVDETLVLQRKRTEQIAQLHVTGRDVEEQQLWMRFEEETGCWELTDEPEERSEGKGARPSPAQEEVLEVLRAAEGPMSPVEIAQILGKERVTIRSL